MSDLLTEQVSRNVVFNSFDANLGIILTENFLPEEEGLRWKALTFTVCDRSNTRTCGEITIPTVDRQGLEELAEHFRDLEVGVGELKKMEREVVIEGAQVKIDVGVCESDDPEDDFRSPGPVSIQVSNYTDCCVVATLRLDFVQEGDLLKTSKAIRDLAALVDEPLVKKEREV